MPYGIYFRRKSNSGWSAPMRAGATSTKTAAQNYAEKKKANANAPMSFRIRKIKGTRGYNDPVTGKSHLPKHRK